MAFEIEVRKSPSEEYLKVHLRDDADFSTIQTILRQCKSIRNVNITTQTSGKVDLTIYVAKTYSTEEVIEEVTLVLNNFFEGNPIDPVFIKETISSISDKAYFQVIDHMLNLGRNLEGSARLTEKWGEERYRDYFVPFLNTVSQGHSATGETFHRKGKTDILFMNKDGHAVFIAECKLWKGQDQLHAAIDQLIGNYVNWRDESTALIVFNQDNKKFGELIEKAIETVTGHPLCETYVGARMETSHSFVFKNPNDPKKKIKLELVLFNFT